MNLDLKTKGEIGLAMRRGGRLKAARLRRSRRPSVSEPQSVAQRRRAAAEAHKRHNYGIGAKYS